MKTATKEYHVLEKEDLERALSRQFERTVSLSEVECVLMHCQPADTMEPNGAYLEFTADEDECDSFDLFWDDDKEGHFFGVVHLAPDDEWPTPDEIFVFEIEEFLAFTCDMDGSD